MASTKSITSDLITSSLSPASTMTVDTILRNVYSTPAVVDAQITLVDAPPPIETNQKTADQVWREIVAGRKEMKEEPEDQMMTLEDFLAKAGAVDVGEEDEDVKMMHLEDVKMMHSGGVYAFDHHPVTPNVFQVLDKVEGSIVGFGNGGLDGGGSGYGRVKRGRAALMEPLDKAAQQRQRRMIKNRESAARSRERKQAYQVELETMAVKLEEENERLLKEKEERTKERFKQLMEKVVPIVEKRRPPRTLRRVNSLEW
ncbi:Basic-leucine zipper (bZIP) transcription factor family protein [Euphorbia peplus]|nr:Basic-leucine zipper (bZIP) transcription factor family protein [Euphorbia peplus]